jgi:hypothetical protein
MSNLTFTMVKTSENKLGISMTEDQRVTGLLLIALIEHREAVVYISNNTLYVYTADNSPCYVSQTQQLNNFLQYEKRRADIDIVARGYVSIKRCGSAAHVSVGDTLLTSVYDDNTKSLLILSRTVDGFYHEYGADLYDPNILSMIDRHGERSIKTLVLAINETLHAKEGDVSVSRILH